MSPIARQRRTRVDGPRLVDRSPRRMAVARTVGPPRQAARHAIPALYRAVYALKIQRKRQGRDFEVEPLRARWANVGDAPPEEWVADWALPVPEDAAELAPQGIELSLERWEYGATAEILHEGPYEREADTVERLLAFVDSVGYEVVGPHEEEYLTEPDESAPRTIVRYRVRRRRPAAVGG